LGVGSGDSQFEAFVASRYGALVRAARLVAPDPSQAEDLVQSALIRTFTRWSSLRDPAAAQAYTHTTMVRLALRGQRRRWRGERPTAVLPEQVAGPDDYAMHDNADVVRRALATIPIEQRAVLVLRYYVQLTEVETAEALKCKVGTVKSRANRALAALREGGLLDAGTALSEATDD
jgi:RNA polymerase sigma-70 factor (sigma-E family)